MDTNKTMVLLSLGDHCMQPSDQTNPMVKVYHFSLAAKHFMPLMLHVSFYLKFLTQAKELELVLVRRRGPFLVQVPDCVQSSDTVTASHLIFSSINARPC